MSTYKLRISYDGTDFQGWQIQPGGRPTIQGSILESLKKILNSDDVSILGSGRTDTGVHAFGQMCRLETPRDFEPEKLKQALNSILPDSIRANEIEYCTEDFHPIYSAKNKQYDYLFTLGRNSLPPQLGKYYYEFPHAFNEELAKKVCELYIGKHDFVNFMNVGTPVKSTVREIFSCDLSYQQNDQFWGQAMGGYWRFSIIGDGFLKQMVRLMVGAMFSVSRGHDSLDDFQASLGGEKDLKIGPVAPAHGLYLVNVTY